VRDEIVSRFFTPQEKIVVVHNGLPPWREYPGAREAGRAALGLSEGEYVLLFTGSGWERKGLRYAIAAMPVDATLLVAGSGKTRGLSAGGNVRFLGGQSREQVDRLLSVSDAFVLPTLYEPFSNACLEALAAGLPVITTSANGFAEVIRPGQEGEVVAPGDVEGLKRAIEQWRATSRRDAVRARLRAKGAQFTIEENLRQTLAAITA
jgi:UDP-glucose:(heptosyl)LPS alpha-1,3-glucosyltransferase